MKGSRWIACADDYALNPAVTQGILNLIERGRLSATSAMVESPAWRHDAKSLPSSRPTLAIGLHLNFTQRFAGQRDAELIQPLSRLILQSYAGALKTGRVRSAIDHQLDRFEDAMGCQPDYVDGHQHVHQFPVIREALLAALTARYPTKLPWIRRTRPVSRTPELKTKIIAALGDAKLGRLLRSGGFASNTVLLGVYDFEDTAAAYQARLQQWLLTASDGAVFMCHPATDASDTTDPIRSARVNEYQVLASDWFGDAIAKAGVTFVATPVLPA